MWTTPSYYGTYMGGNPSNSRISMFELTRAVNERQAAVGITKTQFRKADGTLASDLALSDLYQIYGRGPNGLENLTRIRDAIIAMSTSGKFTTTSGGITPVTKSYIETTLGEDIDADPLRVTESRYWQAMQDSLDLLIYGKITSVPAISWTGASNKKEATSMTSPNAAWLATIADTPTSSNVTEAYWASGPGGPPYAATMYVDAKERFDLSSYAGDIVAGVYSVVVLNNSDIDIDWEAGSVTGTLPALSSPYSADHYWTGSFSTGGNLDIPVEIVTLPSFNPFMTYSSTAAVRINQAIFYTDLASVLSDQ